jgi:hypothetical protein
MPEQEQKPFLTVETGEAYQPIRLSYNILQKEKLIADLNALKCCEKTPTTPNLWQWFWRDECNDLQFESIDTFNKKDHKSIRLATVTIRNNKLLISLTSFKRACLAVPFFHSMIDPSIAIIDHADYLNKVMGLNEKLPHGFKDILNEEELDKQSQKHTSDYNKIQNAIDESADAEQAFAILSAYTKVESKKELPFVERYDFHELNKDIDADTIFLGFYVFLRTRELVAIRHWFGDTEYTLADAADETVQKVFGDMDIDLID